ncbi:FtsK/SpoIIIE domain-containing protein [Streptomyces sp. H10-C2]|uniref:FtsK/SpoIIIE domain-containing protein n=1 Tax=unclassified Streptomyces TaxID=2593676 RepID=UPI0024B9C8B0|nr:MULTISPECIES: FtsK/SpoIIIE domain-containing protein [unclassified Streptomyces]MDJ0345908.1 FtsK/SpoIIIE domain-containing protein [Streptomyces sp. PH10-H1]MDJ0374757.1 FtsK/SpoIIIE domain-containing protein [Streptomyces sp. H10-C2]
MAPPSPTPDTADRSPVVAALMYGIGLALIGYAASSLLHQPQILPPALGAAVALVVIAAIVGTWHQRRSRPIRDLTAALALVLRPDSTQGMVQGSRRKKGIPTRLKIKYPPGFDEKDAKARAKVREIIATRLGGTVEATWQPTKRVIVCRIELTPGATDIVDSDTPPVATTTDDTQEQTRLRGRASGVIQSIMGTTATVERVSFDGDTPNRIDVSYTTTTRDLSHNFRSRVVLQLDTKMPGQWRDIWDHENDRVHFELRPPFPENVRYPVDRKPEGFELPYAVTETNQIEAWKLGSKNPHCLVVGPTGSGKTVFIRNLVAGARALNVPVVLCDPKMTEYLDFEGMPGVTLVTDIEDIASAITRANYEMMDRYEQIKNRTARKGSFGKVLIILDEFFIFKEAIHEVWQQMKAENKELKGREHPCLSHWKRMVVLARTAEMHLVVGIQRPDSEFLTGLARDSFRKRVSLDRATPEAAKMMWGDYRTGTDLPSIQGRAMTNTDAGTEQVQVLRLLTPSDEDAYDAADADVWERLVEKFAQPANRAGGDPLAFLGNIGSRTARELRFDSSKALPPAVDLGKAEEPSEAVETASVIGEEELEEVGVYELEAGDEITLEDDTPVTITDLHYGEEDDREWVEITYSSEDGDTGSIDLDVDDVVTRRPRSAS